MIDAIVHVLAGLNLQLEHPAHPRLLGLANVHHLHTPISAQVPADVHILDLVARLHPTPAVGGAPLAPALAAITRLESFPRGLYAGWQGWVWIIAGAANFLSACARRWSTAAPPRHMPARVSWRDRNRSRNLPRPN